MNSKKCSECGLINFASADTCKKCNAVLGESQEFQPSAVESVINQPQQNEIKFLNTEAENKRKTNGADIACAIIWFFLIPYLGFIFLGLSASLKAAISAPQEASAAAMSAAYAFIGYAGVRALTEVIRNLAGK